MHTDTPARLKPAPATARLTPDPSPAGPTPGPSASLTARENATHLRKWFGATVEFVIATFAITLMVIGVGANRGWLDAHVLPSFLLPRDWFVAIQTGIRVALAAVGAWTFAYVRPAAGRLARHAPGRALPVVAAVVLAVVASEPALRRIEFRPVGWLSVDDEPRRRADTRLGWTLVPSRVGHARVGDRIVEYAIDAHGYRVADITQPVDRARPSIVFTGESVMFGEGLPWNESIPAQVGAITGVQGANLAVHGFGNDQAYLRLVAELPHFARPVAVVSLFMPSLFGRNMDHERPHLNAGLIWSPPVQRWRVQSLLRFMVPYRSTSLIDQGVSLTREIFAATAALARHRGATPVIVVPQFGEETGQERSLRQRIFNGLDVPVAFVPLDPAWRLPWNRHPDARAAHAIAQAIAQRLALKK